MDIEGSTVLWERDRAATQRAVAHHIALFRASIAAHGGIHFKTVGDAVRTAFWGARGADHAAAAAQQALAADLPDPPADPHRAARAHAASVLRVRCPLSGCPRAARRRPNGEDSPCAPRAERR